MRLTPMRFKNYTWPHNPEVYAVERRRRLAVHPVPYGGCVIQDLGGQMRILRGEGVFAGVDAYQEFLKLAEVFREGEPGLLIHPVWKVERAWFASLKVEEEPLPDYVRYQFEFWEDWNGYQGGLQKLSVPGAGGKPGGKPQDAHQEHGVYIVRKGDTLWGIAKRHHVLLTALIAANPQIRNPNLIYPGNRVKLP